MKKFQKVQISNLSAIKGGDGVTSLYATNSDPLQDQFVNFAVD